MQEILVIVACALIALFALGAAVWALFAAVLATEGVDGLFLVAVCLVVAALFAWIPVQSLRRMSLRELFKRKKAAAPGGDAKLASAVRQEERS